MHQENEAWWNFSSTFTEYAGDERWPMELKVLTFGQLDTFAFLYERTHSRTETKRSPKPDICKMCNAPLQLKFHKFSVAACPLAYDCLHVRAQPPGDASKVCARRKTTGGLLYAKFQAKTASSYFRFSINDRATKLWWDFSVWWTRDL